MKHIIILLLCFLSFCSFRAEEFVYTLQDSNFDEFLEEHPSVLVEFYAPWCGHCKALAPEYEKAAKALKSDPSVKTVLAKVDATVEKNLATKFQIKGFPTLKYFSGPNQVSDYGGGRTESTIVSWIKKRELPATSEITSTDELDKFKSKDRVVLVGFFSEHSPEVQDLKNFASSNRESVTVGLVSDENVAKEIGVKMGKLIIYRQFDDPEVVFSGSEVNAKTIHQFVNEEKFPLIDQIGPENYKGYMERGIPIVWIALDPSVEQTKTNIISTLTPIAKKNKGKLSFTWINSKQFAQHVTNLGIKNIPGLLIASEGSNFLFPGSLDNVDEVTKFFENYNAGKLEKFLKTQEPPQTNDESVFVLVGKTFHDIVGQDKDVFVEFYAPWCGHCKKLAPEYDKVGDAFKNTKDLVIAKIDATENDTPEEIKGFPTLIFYPKGSLKGKKYEGDRTADAMINWLKNQATVPVKSDL